MILESTLIGAITGFGGSVVNGIVGYFQTKMQNEHEREMASLTSSLKLAEHQEIAPDEENARLLAHDSSIDGVRAWVRPILTYSSVAIFYTQVVLILGGWMPELSDQQIEILNGFNMMAAAVWAFWFGSRSVEKMQKLFGGRRVQPM